MYISAQLSNPNDFLLVMPSDHLISPNKKFCEIIEQTIKNKIHNKWIIFGVRTKYAINWLWLLTNKNKNNIEKT